MGSARSSQIARENTAEVERVHAMERKERELQRKQQIFEAQLAALKGQYETEREVTLRELEEERTREKAIAHQRLEIARLRRADGSELPIDENGARKAPKGTVR